MESVNNRIYKIRNDLNLSQEDFATKLKLKRNSISLIENGKRNPSDRTISDICRIFNVKKDWLIDGGQGLPEYTIPKEEQEFDELLADLLAGNSNTKIIKEIISKYSRLSDNSQKVISDLISTLFGLENKE